MLFSTTGTVRELQCGKPISGVKKEKGEKNVNELTSWQTYFIICLCIEKYVNDE